MNILTKEALASDQEISLRPSYLLEFVGQEHIKPNLDTFIQATKARKERLDHTLFHGPPGLGKTTLAHIVAKELGAAFYSTSAPALSKPADLVGLLTQLGRGDVLFIDEIHRLPIKIEEILYQAMEDFCVDVIIGEGPTARSVKIDLQPFTLVGATTRLGLLSKPLMDRFGIPLRLNFYKPDELQKILTRASHMLGITLLESGAYEIALRSRGTARIALRILRRVRDFAAVDNIESIDKDSAIKALNRLDIDSLGLDNNDRFYLNFIAQNYNGGPVGVNTIATALSEQVNTIEDTIEPYLIQIGMMHITPRGRIITKSAFIHLGLFRETKDGDEF